MDYFCGTEKKSVNNLNQQTLDILIKQGEGQYIEYKERLDKSFAKEVCAFANASGGKILLGVNDKSKIVGIEDSNKLRSQIQDIARNCDPSIIVNIEYDEINKIFVVSVPDSNEKPHAISEGFFRRIGANSQMITRNEIFAMGLRTGRLKFDEQLCSAFDIDNDIDNNRIKEFLNKSQLSTSTASVKDILKNLNVIRTESGVDFMTNAGVLFFAKEPEKFLKSTKVVCALFQGDSKANILDRKIYSGSLLENLDFTINYILQHIDVRFEITGIERREIPQYPIEAIREAVVNALMHRDYYDSSGDTMVEIYKNSLRISNPGGLVSWLKPEDFGKYSRTRNELIASLLLRTPFVEKMGTGILRMNNALSDSEMPNAIFEYDENNFAIIFKRFIESTPYIVSDGGGKTAQKTRDLILDLIRNNPNITLDEIKIATGKADGTIKEHILRLKNDNVLLRVGPDKSGYWKIID